VGAACTFAVAQSLSFTAAQPLLAPWVLFSGALGAAVVAMHMGSAASVAHRTCAMVCSEVRQQLAPFQTSAGVVHVPEDYAPGYRSVVEAASTAATQRLPGRSVASFLAASVVAGALAWTHGGRWSLTLFVAGATAAAWLVAWASDTSDDAPEAEHRTFRYLIPSTAAARTAAEAVAAVALAVAPFAN
jgi:Na+/H+-translocating membrane pyrophosphatase